ncbi:protein-L-isoaspartate O-methyltransferase family protein [Xanthobacter sp. TB0136]|uniref:protein-L-isoaspartate O-methyltransferase family protein n=1 Tax=Xanthobacter sp. TB0136 TaxID=3459177 RepID=UPI00403A553F
MIDFVELRRGMVDSQVRANDVTDHRIVGAMLEIPRERFVPESLRSFAYIDDDLVLRPAAEGKPARYLPEPMVLARLVQLADVRETDHVLDIGVGTGYSSALLSRLAQQIVALEEDEALAATAAQTLSDLDVDNVAVMTGPLAEGWSPEAGYDVIFLNGAVDAVPPALLGQLKDGGRLVCVVGRGGAARATVFTNVAGHTGELAGFNASLPLLPGFETEPGFVF